MQSAGRETSSTPGGRSVPGKGNPRWLLSGSQRQAIDRLIEQQFWLWGCDIRRPEGNLLAISGFERERQPTESGRGISRYQAQIMPGRLATVWGFGLWVADPDLGCVFIPRSGLVPRYSASAVCVMDAWTPTWFDRFPVAPQSPGPCIRLVAETFAWIAAYESGVIERAGEEYRHNSLAAWPRPACGVEDIAARWTQAAGMVERHAEGVADHGRSTAIATETAIMSLSGDQP